jgi:hypothetical protein
MLYLKVEMKLYPCCLHFCPIWIKFGKIFTQRHLAVLSSVKMVEVTAVRYLSVSVEYCLYVLHFHLN